MRLARGRNWLVMVAIATGLAGCVHHHHEMMPQPDPNVPRELEKIILPPYQIEPPDILYIEVLIPPLDPSKQPYVTSFPPQPIQGQFLVRPDGYVNLGIYGSVSVAGLTTDQARERIREFIASVANFKANSMAITVDVAAYNSKTYYVITDGAGNGESVQSFAITGSETVLDALARIGGVPPVGSTKRIWIARRNPNCGAMEQVLPVDWCALSRQGSSLTNYQVMPGDRIYVQAQKLITVDNALAKILSPVQRVFGVILLGSSTVNSINGNFGNNNNFP